LHVTFLGVLVEGGYRKRANQGKVVIARLRVSASATLGLQRSLLYAG